MSTDIKLPKVSKINQSGNFLSSLLSIAVPLMKAAVPVAKYVLASLGVTAAASAIDAEIKKNMVLEQLIISNEDMNDIIKIVQAL